MWHHHRDLYIYWWNRERTIQGFLSLVGVEKTAEPTADIKPSDQSCHPTNELRHFNQSLSLLLFLKSSYLFLCIYLYLYHFYISLYERFMIHSCGVYMYDARTPHLACGWLVFNEYNGEQIILNMKTGNQRASL